MHELLRRKAAIEATRDRFEGKPHAYGSVDCVKVAAAHARNMGHRKALGLAKAGSYRSAIGAVRALKRAGFDDVRAAIDAAGFEPIAPARLLPGDLVAAAGSDGLDSVGIWIGNMTLLGFHETQMAKGLYAIRVRSLAELKAWRL